MFIAILFKIAKYEDNLSASVDEWIKTIGINRKEYYSAMRKKEILPFASTWMDFEDIILNKTVKV